MDKAMLTLKPGVTLTEAGSQIGLVLDGQSQFSKNAWQAKLIRALSKQPQPPESLMALLRMGDGPPRSDNDGSLTIAEFILDFGDYLES